jgi:hypothetical protein
MKLFKEVNYNVECNSVCQFAREKSNVDVSFLVMTVTICIMNYAYQNIVRNIPISDDGDTSLSQLLQGRKYRKQCTNCYRLKKTMTVMTGYACNIVTELNGGQRGSNCILVNVKKNTQFKDCVRSVQ